MSAEMGATQTIGKNVKTDIVKTFSAASQLVHFCSAVYTYTSLSSNIVWVCS